MSNSIKKIVMITRNFPPLVGGMEKLNFNIYKCFQTDSNVHFIGPNGSEKFINSSTSYKNFPIKPLWLYILVSLFKAISSCSKKPDLVFCGSGATALAGYILSRLTSSKLVIYLHGLDIVAKKKLYRLIFIPCIKKADKIIVNSQHTKSLAVGEGMLESNISILNPGVDIPDHNSFLSKKNQILNKYQLQNKKIILILGRITKRKGIVEFISNVMPGLVEKNHNIHLLIAGSEAINAINYSENITKKIIQTINENKLASYITLTGDINDEMMDAIYFSADLMVFPVLNLPDDVEGFGMVALEAAAHGVKTVAFNVGGISDAIQEGESGFLIESNNYSKFGDVIFNNLTDQSKNLDFSAIEFSKKYEWIEFNKKLKKIIYETIFGK